MFPHQGARLYRIASKDCVNEGCMLDPFLTKCLFGKDSAFEPQVSVPLSLVQQLRS